MNVTTIFFKSFLFFSIITSFLYANFAKDHYIRKLEYTALEQIKNAYNIEGTVWNNLLKNVSILRQDLKELLKKSDPHVLHDANIPQEKLDSIYAIFKDYNINPQSVNIIIDTTLENTTTRAYMKTTLVSYTSIEKYAVKNPILAISPKILDEDISQFKTIIYHELGHLLEAHVGIKLLLKILTNTENPKTKKAQDAMHYFKKTCEFIADQYCAAQDKTVFDIVKINLKPKPLYEYPTLNKWYPTIPERWQSFLAMKKEVWKNTTYQQIV